MDNVNKPSHYNFGDIEVIDYIRDKLTKDQFTGYCLGNVLKYVSRWEHKGGLEDLKKARVYLNWAIEKLDAPVSEFTFKVDSSINEKVLSTLTGIEVDACDECGENVATRYVTSSGKKVCYKCWHKSEDDLK